MTHAARQPEAYAPFTGGAYRGVVLESWRQRISGDPVAFAKSLPHEVVRERPWAIIYRVRAGDQTLYVKHYVATRGGLIEAIKRLTYRPVATRNHDVAQAMESRGIDVPRIVLAATSPGAGDVLITLEALGTSLHHLLIDAKDDTRSHRLLGLAGAAVAKLHTAGFTHGDLLPGNLLVEEHGGTVTFLDNDRTRFSRIAVASRSARIRNLAQFCFRVVCWQGVWAMRVFLAAYSARIGGEKSSQRRERLAVYRAVRHRLHADPPYHPPPRAFRGRR